MNATEFESWVLRVFRRCNQDLAATAAVVLRVLGIATATVGWCSLTITNFVLKVPMV
jgi:hypothetical protein